VVQKSDDDVNRALAAFSAPSISYRNFTSRPSESGEPKQKDLATSGFRLLVAAIPEAAEMALNCDRARLPSAEASVETLPEQAPLTKYRDLDGGRSNAPASSLRSKGLAPNPASLKAGHSTVQTDLAIEASVRRTPAYRAPDRSADKTPLAAVFSALNAGRLPPEDPAEAEQKLRDIFSML
jgi:hypothetical protein